MTTGSNSDDDALTRAILRKVLRTLERTRQITRVPPEVIAAVILPHVRVNYLVEIMAYFEELARHISAQTQRKCAGCGHDIRFKDDPITRTRVCRRVAPRRGLLLASLSTTRLSQTQARYAYPVRDEDEDVTRDGCAPRPIA